MLVASVDADSAASKGGLKARDVITAVDVRRISNPQDFTIVREKQERELKLEGVARWQTGQRRERINGSEVNVL